VTALSCEETHGLLALEALGRLEPADVVDVVAHLNGCAECRLLAAELRSTASALRTLAASRAPAPDVAMTPALHRAVLDGLENGARSSRRRRRALVATGTAAVILGALLFWAAGSHAPAAPARQVVLAGSSGAAAHLVLAETTWGTSLSFREAGLPKGVTFTVQMASASGRWWTAGTFRGQGSSGVEATMACAAGYRSITAIEVLDPQGHVVLSDRPSPYLR